jgi:hypothetical protein
MRSYQLKVAALGLEVPLWRRIVVPADITFARFHNVVQAMFGWSDEWDHQWTVGGLSLGKPDDQSGFEVENERKFRLDAQMPKRHLTVYYAYGFDDGWTFEIDFESESQRSPSDAPFVCLEGAGSPHLERVGGPNSDLDLEAGFDLAGTNERLAKA